MGYFSFCVRGSGKIELTNLNVFAAYTNYQNLFEDIISQACIIELTDDAPT